MKKTLLFFFTIISFSTQAQITFEKTYGDTLDCSGINVIQTFDGGFLITATEYPISQYEGNLFIIRTNPLGDTLWTKTYAIDSGAVSKGIQTHDSGFVFTGKKGINLFILKVSSTGDSLWEKKYNFGTTYSWGFSLIESTDHTLFVVGENFIGSVVCCNPLVIHTDTAGNLLGSINLPISYGRAYDITETPDSNLVISYSEIAGSPPIPLLIKVKKNGVQLWNRVYSNYCQCNVNLTHDNGFIISGSNINGNKPYLIKTDSAGVIIWNKSYSSYKVFNDWLKVTQSNDGGYLMVGGLDNPLSDLILLKINSLGDSVWGRVFGGTDDDFGRSVITTDDNGFAIVGYSKSFGSGFKEVYFIKTDSLGLIASVKTYPFDEKQIHIFPNPFSSSTTIQLSNPLQSATISIYDVMGKQVKQLENLTGKQIIIQRDNLKAGMYFFRIQDSNGFVGNGKMVVE